MTENSWRRALLWRAVGLAAAGLFFAGSASAVDIGAAPQYGSFGVRGPNPPGFLGTLSVQNAVHDATGVLYVVETWRISKFDRDGNVQLTWPCGGCYGIDVNQATGDVYVALQPSNLIQQFHADGSLVRQWGSFGSGDGQFKGPHGIAVDPVTGSVFVYDTGNGRIQVFDGTGVYLRQFGQIGLSNSGFSGNIVPGAVAFDAVNRWVYVTDPIRYHVQKWTEAGTFLTSWGDPPGTSPGHFRWPRSVEVDGSGNVYVTSTDSEVVQYFTPDGVYLGQFQGPHNVAQGPFHPRDIAINRLTGEKYVNAAYAFREDKFDASNTYVKSFGGKHKDGSYLEAPCNVAASPNGDVYVLDSGDFMMKRFSPGGAFRAQWGAPNAIDYTQPGLIGQGNQAALGIEPDGSVWTGIVGVFYQGQGPEPWLTRFDRNGVVTNYSLRKPVASNYEEQIRDVAVEPVSRDLFVADASFNRLKRVSQSGDTLINLPVIEAGGLAFAAGKLYMVDPVVERVRRYTDQLVEETSFGTNGTGDGQFNFDVTSGLDVRASDGHIFVADSRNHRIQELDAAGGFVAKRGGLALGSGAGQFVLPEGLALSSSADLLYVADTFNHRIQMFCLTTTAACDAIVDPDGDGKRDYEDNCPTVYNPNQADADSDGIGDACDACPLDPANDVDGDGVCGNADNCPTVYNPDQADLNRNGIGDACEICTADPLGDADADGICGSVDNCPFKANPLQTDSGSLASSTPDGIGDACQCGDVAGNGIIEPADVTAFRGFLAQDPAATYSAPAKCKVATDGGPCSILDVIILEQALAPGGVSTISQRCAAANP